MIKTLSFSVTGQHIKLTEPAMLVAGTVNVYNASFSFDADWDGFQRTAVFAVDGVSREQLLTDDACTLPWEVLSAGKYLRVGVYGTKDDIRLPTIWTEHALYISSGAGPTEEAAEPSPTLVEQLLNKIGSLDSLKTEDKASLVAAINEIWASGGGGSGGTTDHSKLTNRGADDQHPMSAITGLVDALDGKQPTGYYLTQESDPTVPAWAKAAEKPSYTAPEVGADPSGTAESKVASHNTGTDAHSDIRLLISGLTDRLNALADSDDTTLDQMSEVVAYIKSNRTLIEAITTNKVSVTDIVDNLTTNVANKPLSAAQGVALKALIDAISVPDKLPNPNALTFSGAASGSYDGSAPLNVEIPSGGGSGNASYEDTVIVDITIEEEVQTYRTSVLSSEAVNALENADFIFFCADLKPPTEQADRGTLLASIYGSYYHATKFFYNDSAYTKVTPSSAADGVNIAESIGVVNKANPGKNMFQTAKWKNTDNKYGGEGSATSRASINIPGGSVFNISTSGVFGVGTTVKLVARRLV